MNGALWVTLEKFVAKFLNFGMGLVLARLLTPEDFGTVALLSIFISVAGSLASCGFGNALVQRKDAGELEFNSVFYISVAVAIIVYLALFFAAPFIARFYGVPGLCAIMRVVSFQIIFHAINSVQDAELSRRMLFNLRFRVSFIVCIASAVSGLVFALLGYGPWALVYATFISGVMGVISRWFIIAWRPKLMFSFEALRSLFSYGWKLTLSSLMTNAYEQFYGFLVGKVYSPRDLAFVEKGNATPQLLVNTINETLLSVTFPALSKLQDNVIQFRAAMRKMIQCSTFLMFPLTIGMAICARQIVLILFGHQWLAAVPYVQIACFSKALAPFSQINVVALWAQGRSDLLLKLEFLKKGVGLLLMFISIKYGILVFMSVIAFVSVPFTVFVNIIPNAKLLGYTLRMQIVDVLPIALSSCVMGLVVLLTGKVVDPKIYLHFGDTLGSIVVLIMKIAVGVTIYVAINWSIKPPPFVEAYAFLVSLFRRLQKFINSFLGSVV